MDCLALCKGPRQRAQAPGFCDRRPLLAGWPILLGLTGVPAALQLILLPFFPESPRYLLIQKKDESAAEKGEGCCGFLLTPDPQAPQP